MTDDTNVQSLPVTIEALAFAPAQSLGEGLRAAREHLNLGLDELSAITKVRPAYLAAIEAMDFAKLPSRPFTLGYVRAYARALGLDETRTITRFREDAPLADESLPNPLGIGDGIDPRRRLLVTIGLGVLAAIVVWNIAQRAINGGGEPATRRAIQGTEEPAQLIGAVELGDALPPPVEATLPPPYVTPGLENYDPEVAAAAKAAAELAALEAAPFATRPLAAKGPIRGAPAGQSRLIVQATRIVVLLVRQENGPVLDVTTLQEGEAYRVPMTAGVLVDVSMPSSVDYFIDGMLAGTLKESVTPVATLMKGVPPLPTPPAPAPATAPATALGSTAAPAARPATAGSPAPRPATAASSAQRPAPTATAPPSP